MHESSLLPSPRLASFLLVLVGLVLFAACATPPPDVHEQVAARSDVERGGDAEDAPLVVGAAKFPFTPDLTAEEVVLAAPYGVRRPQLVEGELYARAVVIERGTQTLALVTLDQWLVPPPFVRALKHRLTHLELSGLEMTLDDVWVIATGTHSSDGGYWRSVWAELGPLGLYREAAERKRLVAAESAVRIALRRMQPAAMYVDPAGALNSSADTAEGPGEEAAARPPLTEWSQEAKRDTDEMTARPAEFGKLTEPRRIVFRHAEHGMPIAQLVYHPVAGALLGKESRVLSGDWPAELARQLEEQHPGTVACVFPGNFGDVVARVEAAPATMDTVRRYAERIRSRLPALEPFPFEPEAERGRVEFTSLRLEAAVPAARNPRGLLDELDWIERPARLRLLRLGDVLLTGWPSQPGRAHHEALYRAARTHGHTDAWTIGNVGGYYGATLPRKSDVQSSERYFGRYLGNQWLATLRTALELLVAEAEKRKAEASEKTEENEQSEVGS